MDGLMVSGAVHNHELFGNLLSQIDDIELRDRISASTKFYSGWLFVGADFASLEDRISALTTQDSQKLKVYVDGYDGHSVRAFKYWPERMPWIENTKESINGLKNTDEGDALRSLSKQPTFLLTYAGTYIGLMGLGFTKAEALAIEKNYHELYVESDNWVREKLVQATSDGYVTVAFGLRVRTPILKQTILNNDTTPYEAQSESRTAGNALGQSYGLLNNRAGIELQERCIASDYAMDVRPVAQIHDALYYLVKNELGSIKWLNDNLGQCMAWQELPEIQHDIVKLSGELDLFVPHWGNAITLPNNISKREILDIAEKNAEKVKELTN